MKLISALSLLLTLAPSVAHADWYMIGPEDWKIDTGFTASSLTQTVRGVQHATGSVSANVVAPVHLPIGSVVTSLFCQVYDDGPSAFVTSLMEIATDDNAAVSSTGRRVASTTGSSNAGYQKIGTSTIDDGFIKDWSSTGTTAGARYYSYVILAPLPVGGSYALRGCAIGYNPP